MKCIIKILSKLPSGAFLIRPHDTKSELHYLSFNGTPEEGTKHAIIRKEILLTNKRNVFVYKCGKVGPCRSIDDLLQ